MDKPVEPRIEVAAVVKRDYLVSLLLLSPLALWAAFVIRNMGGGSAMVYLIIAVAGSLFGLAAGLARIGHILSLAEKGEHADAEVKQIIMGKNRGRIHFRYTVEGQSFDGVQAFRAREQIKKVKKGLRVTVAVDPHKPKSAIIPSLFRDDNPFFEMGTARRQ